MREGKGTYYFDKDNNFSGYWKNNIPHGDGILIDGEKKLEGLFRYGKFIKEEKVEGKEKDKKKKSSDRHKHKKHSHKSKKKAKQSESDENSNDNKDNKEKKLVEIDGIPGVATKKKI